MSSTASLSGTYNLVSWPGSHCHPMVKFRSYIIPLAVTRTVANVTKGTRQWQLGPGSGPGTGTRRRDSVRKRQARPAGSWSAFRVKFGRPPAAGPPAGPAPGLSRAGPAGRAASAWGGTDKSRVHRAALAAARRSPRPSKNKFV